MIACSSISTCVKNVSHLSGCGQRQMTSWISGVTPRAPSGTCCFCFLSDHLKLKYSEISVLKTNKCLSVVGFQAVNISYFRPSIAKQRSNLYTSTVRSIISSRFCLKTCLGIPLGSEHTTLRHIVPKQGMIPKIICNARSSSWLQGCVPGLIFGFLVSYSTSERVHAEALQAKKNKDQDCDSSSVSHSHGKNVYTDYSLIGIPGDGRCMFRSVAHGACVRSGKPAPDERMQRELADELRASVANEFIRRRKETEWDRSFIASARKASQGLVLYYVWQTRELRTFRAQYKNELKMKLLPKEIETFAAKGTVIANRFIEGDFETYVSQIRKPHVWGGEPELLMASHVLQMPITVYMYDKDSGGLISIAEYGQEYGKDDPVKVLYHGFGHYDALQIHENKGARSRL